MQLAVILYKMIQVFHQFGIWFPKNDNFHGFQKRQLHHGIKEGCCVNASKILHINRHTRK